MIMESLIWLVTIVAANILLRPFISRLPVPRWLERLRSTRRSRVLFLVWGSVIALLAALWFLGDQPAPARWLLPLVWVGIPLLGIRLTAFLFRR